MNTMLSKAKLIKATLIKATLIKQNPINKRRAFSPKQLPFGFHGGLSLEPKKRALQSTTRTIPEIQPPGELVIPLLNYHKESLCPEVSINDHVIRGQLLAPGIVASATGKVCAIEARNIIHPEGMTAKSVVLEVIKTTNTPNLNTANWQSGAPQVDLSERDTPEGKIPRGNKPDNNKRKVSTQIDKDAQLTAFLAHPDDVLQRSALSGLGGAGFPTAEKLSAVTTGIQTLIINAVECEPEIACDEALMQAEASEIALGINALIQFTQCKSCLLAIEDSKPAAIEAMSDGIKNINADIRLVIIPTRYPTGAESPLIQTLTNKFIPHNEKPVNHGIMCINVATAYALWQAITGKPLDSRIVSLGGSAMPNPMNVQVRFGTSVRDVLQATGNASAINTGRIRAGGPLSGFDLSTLDVPITAQTNALLAEPYVTETPAQPCIRCSECVDVCPANLLPQQLHWYAMSDDHDKCQQLKLDACIECGCCDLVCPASIKLTQSFRYAKSAAKSIRVQQQKAQDAELRFDQHEARVARRKQEKTQAIEQRKQLLKARNNPQSDQIKAAIARAKLSAKKKNQQ